MQGPRPARALRSRQEGSLMLGPWFIASYDGECAGCGDEICEDDEIRADGEGGYLCGDCGDREDDD